MDRVVDEFLAEPFAAAEPGSGSDSLKVSSRRQIVSLGAGLDSRYFRLWQEAKTYNNKQEPDATGASSGVASGPTAAAAAATEEARLVPELPPLVVNGKVLSWRVQHLKSQLSIGHLSLD